MSDTPPTPPPPPEGGHSPSQPAPSGNAFPSPTPPPPPPGVQAPVINIQMPKPRVALCRIAMSILAALLVGSIAYNVLLVSLVQGTAAGQFSHPGFGAGAWPQQHGDSPVGCPDSGRYWRPGGGRTAGGLPG